jgi:hypothetical protein
MGDISRIIFNDVNIFSLSLTLLEKKARLFVMQLLRSSLIFASKTMSLPIEWVFALNTKNIRLL